MNQRDPGKRDWTRIHSIGFAIRGIGFLLGSEVNARIHLVATVLVVVVGLFLHLSVSEWGLVALAIGAVWTAEGFNTAIESLVDFISPEIHPLAGKIKDVAAGAVLIAAISAAIVGLLVFGPPILRLAGYYR